MDVSTLDANGRKALISKFTAALKALEVYDSDSANPALVTTTNTAVNAAQASTLLATQAVITSGTKVTAPVTGSGTSGITPTIVAKAVTALVLS